MALDFDRTFDRRRLARKLTFWRVAAVVLAVALVAAIAARIEGVGRSAVAYFEVSNIILDDTDRIDLLDEIADSGRYKALMVKIDSPGGTVVGGESLYLALRRVAEKKPVVAIMGELATSAGYMVALGADHILARQGSVTGSIGVLMQTVEVTGLLEKLGITAESIKSGPLKATPNPLEKLTPEGRDAAEEVIRDTFDLFVGMVAERRQLDRAVAERLADGRVYTGRQALANGLIDAIGGEREARAWLRAERGISDDLPTAVVEVEKRRGFVAELFDDLFGKAMLSERLRLDGLISLWHPELH